MTSNFNLLHIDKEPSPDLIKLLEENIIGTPGKGMLYQHCKVPEKISGIADPYFVSIQKDNTVIGTCCFCKRTTLNNGKPIESFYIRYFSFKSSYRRKNPSVNPSKLANSQIKNEVSQILAGKGLTDDKFFFYAYVDPANERSVRLTKSFGFHPIREFSTVLFSRFLPKCHSRVTKAASGDINSIVTLLKEQYQRYNMVSFDQVSENNYYIIKDGAGNIMAGLQANIEHWKILDLPGTSGKFMLKILPYIPVIKKLFQPDYRFLTYEAIIIKKGREADLSLLFESVLAMNNLNSAIMWADTGSPLYDQIKSIKQGALNLFYKNTKAQVMAKFINIDNSEIRALKRAPAYISSYDLT